MKVKLSADGTDQTVDMVLQAMLGGVNPLQVSLLKENCWITCLEHAGESRHQPKVTQHTDDGALMISLYGEIKVPKRLQPWEWIILLFALCPTYFSWQLRSHSMFLGRHHCRESRDSRNLGYQWKNDGHLPWECLRQSCIVEL